MPSQCSPRRHLRQNCAHLITYSVCKIISISFSDFFFSGFLYLSIIYHTYSFSILSMVLIYCGFFQTKKNRKFHKFCSETSLTNLTSWLPGTVDGDFDALGVHRHQGGHRPDLDHKVEALQTADHHDIIKRKRVREKRESKI